MREKDADRIVERLKASRDAHGGRPEDERRADIERILREHTATLPEAEALELLTRVRTSLVDESRRRDQRITELEGALALASSEADALRSEHDRLSRELARSAAVAPGPISVPADSLEGLRGRLLRLVESRGEAAGAAADPGPDTLVPLQEALLGFALRLSITIQKFKDDMAPGADPRYTKIGDARDRKIGEQFRACVEGNSGDSLQRLRQMLQDNEGFLVLLQQAYRAALRHGVKGLLQELDPGPIRQAHTPRFMPFDANGAFQDFERKYVDLHDRPTEAMWLEFFDAAFRDRLAGRQDPDHPSR